MRAGLQETTPAPGGIRARELERLLELTREIRGCIDAGEWERSAVAEAERRSLLAQFFRVPPAATELETIAAALKDMIRLNDEAIGLAKHRSRALARDVEMAGRGRLASVAYLNHAGPVR